MNLMEESDNRLLIICTILFNNNEKKYLFIFCIIDCPLEQIPMRQEACIDLNRIVFRSGSLLLHAQ